MKKKRTVTRLIIYALIALFFVAVFAVFPVLNYTKAVKLYNESKFEEAAAKLSSAGGYSSSSGLAEMCRDAIALESTSVGDRVTFGKYEQDGDESDGSEDISWIVLEKKDSEVLLISEFALDAKPYNTASRPATWESSSLRKWLNGHFLQTAFSEAQRNMMAYSDVSAHKSDVNVVDSGSDTKDMVYLLSLTEFEKAFPDRASMHCRACAAAQPLLESTSPGELSCWLRSSGYSFPEADAVTYYAESGGEYSYTLGNGFPVDTPLAVRPVIRLAYGRAASPSSRPVLKVVFGKGGEDSEGMTVTLTPARSTPMPTPKPTPSPTPEPTSSPTPEPTPETVSADSEDVSVEETRAALEAAEREKHSGLENRFKDVTSDLGRSDVLQCPSDQINRVGADSMYSAYRLILNNITASVGKCDSADLENGPDGLAYAKLVDFNGGGYEELFVLFKQNKCLYEQVYRWDGDSAELVFSRRLTGNVESGTRVREYLYTYNGRSFICSFTETLTGEFCPGEITVYEFDGETFIKTEVLCAFVSPGLASGRILESYKYALPNPMDSYRLYYRGCIVCASDTVDDDYENCRGYYNQCSERDLRLLYSRYDYSALNEYANQKWLCHDYGTVLMDKSEDGVSFEVRPFDHLMKTLSGQS